MSRQSTAAGARTSASPHETSSARTRAESTNLPAQLRVPLVFLAILWAALLFGGFVLGGSAAEGSQRIPTWCRMASSLVLVVTGWTWVVAITMSPATGGTARTTARRVALLVTFGMALGTLGDFFNAGLMDGVIPLENPVMGGIISFGLGHLAYIAACVLVARRTRLSTTRAYLVGIIGWEIAAIVGWYFTVYTGTKNQELIYPALGYSMLLAGTAGVATSMALQNLRFVGLALGAALFLASDLILAYRLFGGELALGSDTVWLAYGPGQMLIVFAIGACVVAVWNSENRARGAADL